MKEKCQYGSKCIRARECPSIWIFILKDIMPIRNNILSLKAKVIKDLLQHINLTELLNILIISVICLICMSENSPHFYVRKFQIMMWMIRSSHQHSIQLSYFIYYSTEIACICKSFTNEKSVYVNDERVII